MESRDAIIARMTDRVHPETVTVQLGDFAQVLAFIADEQSKSARILEANTKRLIAAVESTDRQTKTLRRLTLAIVVLSFLLLAFTMVLVKDTRALVKREAAAERSEPKQDRPPESKP